MSELHSITCWDISHLVVPLQLSVPVYKSLLWALNEPRERKNRLLKHLNIELQKSSRDWDEHVIEKNNATAQFMYLNERLAVLFFYPRFHYFTLIWDRNDFFARSDFVTKPISERFFFYLLQAAIDLFNNGSEEVDISMWFHRKTAEYDALVKSITFTC